MIRILTIAFIIWSSPKTSAQEIPTNSGIQFYEGTWKEAVAYAKEQDKLLFIDAYAKWCGPCKRMAKYVFTDEAVGSFYNENFINLKLDMESKDGRTFDPLYPVSAYPTLIFLDGEGKLVKRSKGAKDVTSLIDLGKKVLNAYDGSGKYAALYEEGNRDYETVYKYVQALNRAGKPSLKIANEYLKANPSMTEEQKALFLFEATTEADSRIFDMMLAQKELILKQVEPAKYKAKVINACKATLVKAVEYDMIMLKDETNEKCIAALGKKEGEAENLKLDMDYFIQVKDNSSYLKAAEKLYKKKGKNDPLLAKWIVEDIDNNFTKKDKEIIEKGVGFSKALYKKDASSDHAVLHVRMLLKAESIVEAEKMLSTHIATLSEDDKDLPKLKSILKYVESQKTSNS